MLYMASFIAPTAANPPLLSLLSLQLPVPGRTDSEASSVFQRSDATVVLFYDHLTHCTPDEHVESIARCGLHPPRISTAHHSYLPL
jgi:hypothetical protein